jgi:hypothetical protein
MYNSSREDEIGARKSGLLTRSAFESLAEVSYELYEQFMLRITMSSGGLVSFKLASELSASMASNLLSAVYAQINPDVVGNDFRDLNVALQYGIRLIRNAGNADLSTVLHLVNHYPSHDFIIDNEEASELFQNVDQPEEELYSLIGYLGEIAYNEPDVPDVRPLTIRPVEEGERDDGEGKGTTTETALDGGGGTDRPSDTEPAGEKRADSATDDDSARDEKTTDGTVRDGRDEPSKSGTLKIVT